MNLTYQCAGEEDVPAIARIRAAEWETEAYWQRRIAGYMDGSANPQTALAQRVIYVAKNGNEVVGMIAGHLTRRFECDGELEWINVSRQFRGQGVAIALLQMLADWFAAQNAFRICVDVSPDNTVARRFYARSGASEFKPHWMVWDDIRKARGNR